MILRLAFATAFALQTLILPVAAAAATYINPDFGFTLGLADGWRPEITTEGSDSVIRLHAPDNGAYVEVRAFTLATGVSVTALREAFASEVLPDGVLSGTASETVAGMIGEVASWRLSADGKALMVAGFFGIVPAPGQPQTTAYILLAIAAEAEYSDRSAEMFAILDSFQPGPVPPPRSGDDGSAATGGVALPGVSSGVRPPDADGLADTQGMIEQRHPELGFTIFHLPGWAADQPQPHILRIGPADVAPHMRPSVTVEAVAGSAYGSMEVAARDLMAQLSDLPGIAFDSDGPQIVPTIRQNGQPLVGWSFGAGYDVNGVRFRQLTFLFWRPEPPAWHFVYITGPHDTVLARKPELMQVLSTMRIIPFSSN